jgi:hypothetical protein
MLSQFDAELVDWLMEAFRDIGIDVRTGNAVIGIERTEEGFRVHTQMPQGPAAYPADLEQIPSWWNREGFPNQLCCDSSCIAGEGGQHAWPEPFLWIFANVLWRRSLKECHAGKRRRGLG